MPPGIIPGYRLFVLIYVVCVAIAALFSSIYLLVIFREVPGAVEQRLGEFEDAPNEIGKWNKDTDTDEGKAATAAGEVREVRYWLEDGSLFRRARLIKQVRYRDLTSREITRHDPDVAVVRKRVKT